MLSNLSLRGRGITHRAPILRCRFTSSGATTSAQANAVSAMLSRGRVLGDPNECRQHAANCMRLAKEASTEELRKTFAELANKWLIMAGDRESARAMLDAAKEEIKDQG